MNSNSQSTDPFSRPGTPPPIPQMPPHAGSYSEQTGIPYASFGIRIVALMIDIVLVFVISWLIWRDDIVTATEYGFEVQIGGSQNLIWLAYFLSFWILLSTTPGKFICRIKIVNAEGKRISPLQAVMRIPLYIFIVIGGWFALDHPQNQTLHDRVAKTYVVKI